ncbi:DNA-3-methyladenine glycosylase family protein [Sulfurisphaera ohwakuensis]|uniref:DNA-3-methyladenine glycosylase family protein n=1 Tax=Sulfurisphaera ohwakuensis TaxID=69656 RepID=UPI0036F37335
MHSIEIEDIVPPFNLLYTAWLLKRVRNNRIDEILPDKSYVRVFNKNVVVKVKQIGGVYNPKLRVEIFSNKHVDEDEIIKTLRRVLGLDVDLTDFYNKVLDSPYFSGLTRKFIGAKPVVFPTLLETVINAISCQQISLNVCLTLVNKLAEKFGGKLTVDDMQINVFPTVEDLINAKPEELRSLGYSSRKVEYILNSVNALKDKDSFESIKDLKGLGKWSINYILLRGLRRIDVIPTGDVGLRNKAKRFLGIDNIEEMLSSVKEYSGMIYYYLLLENLYHEGLL